MISNLFQAVYAEAMVPASVLAKASTNVVPANAGTVNGVGVLSGTMRWRHPGLPPQAGQMSGLGWPASVVPAIAGTKWCWQKPAEWCLLSQAAGACFSAGPRPGGYGAAFWRHCTAARQGGSKWGGRGKALRGLAGTLGRPSVSCSRSTALFPACRPENADLQFSRLELIRAWTNGTGSTQRWPPGLSPATCVAAHGISPNVPGTRPDLNTPHTSHAWGGGWRARPIGWARHAVEITGSLAGSTSSLIRAHRRIGSASCSPHIMH